MFNYVFFLKFCKCIFDEWKHELDEEAEKNGLCMKDVMFGEVNDHTAIYVCRNCWSIITKENAVWSSICRNEWNDGDRVFWIWNETYFTFLSYSKLFKQSVGNSWSLFWVMIHRISFRPNNKNVYWIF